MAHATMTMTGKDLVDPTAEVLEGTFLMFSESRKFCFQQHKKLTFDLGCNT